MKKFIIFILTVIITMSLIAGFIILNSKPDKLSEKEKEKAISEMLGRKANLNPDIKTGNTTFEGKYAEFKYPAGAKIYEYRDPNLANNENLLESFSFDLESPRRIFNYTVIETDAKSPEDIPAVNFRKNKANGYKESLTEADGVSGLSFSKEGSGEYLSEKSAFFLKNGNLYSISITGSNLRDIEELYKQIVASFRFK